jgi:glycosyltransferase involved in cell wall biosynthesis
MNQEDKTIFVISNPHVLHYKKIVKKWVKREKNYQRYSTLFDYLYHEDRLEILRSGNLSSFKNPNLNKIFSKTIFNNVEFFIWLCINRLLSRKIKVYKDIDDISSENRVILDFAATWDLGTRNHILKILSFKGIVLVHMTHYFKNSSLIFDLLPRFKYLVLLSEGNILENDFFRKNIREKLIEINVPFVVDHLDNQAPKEPMSNSRNQKCLIMGSPNMYHYNSDLLDFYNTDFLNPDRTNFRQLAITDERFIFEPRITTENLHDFKKTLRELYLEAGMFFTGSEIIGLPSINTFEGMYFGALYIGPRDPIHKSLGFVDGVNYLSYTPGDYSNFIEVVNYAFTNSKLTAKISKQGQKFIIDNFKAQVVFGRLVEKVDILLVNKKHQF